MIAILPAAEAPAFAGATRGARRLGTIVAGPRRVRFRD
jgi:hypothetical protein